MAPEAKDKEDKKKHSKVAKAKSASKTKSKARSKKAKAPEVQAADGSAAPKKKRAPGVPGVKRAPLLPRTFFAKPGQHGQGWKIIDATGIPVGRLSSLIAKLLMGKDKPIYTRSADVGDHVVVVNAKKVLLTGKKWEDKVYQYHTGYPGGLKTFTAREILSSEYPDRIIKWAVYGMLPKGHMGRQWFKKLRVYEGTEHPHIAQKPEVVKLPELGFWERA